MLVFKEKRKMLQEHQKGEKLSSCRWQTWDKDVPFHWRDCQNNRNRSLSLLPQMHLISHESLVLVLLDSAATNACLTYVTSGFGDRWSGMS